MPGLKDELVLFLKLKSENNIQEFIMVQFFSSGAQNVHVIVCLT